MGEQQGAMPPPPGVTPDFENPKDQLNTIMIVTQALCMVFVTVFIFLRVWIRVTILRSFTAEDCSYQTPTAILFFFNCLGLLTVA